MNAKWSVKNNWILPGAFLFDRLIKWYAFSSGSYYLNSGVSFGLAKSPLWVVAGFVVLFVVFRMGIRSKGVQLLFVGGFSNWIDRWAFGGVVDMFNGGFFWFNVADVMITVGVIMIIYESIYERKV